MENMESSTYTILMNASGQFIDLIQQETNFLKEHNITCVQSLLPEKQKLSDLHQKACQEFNSQNGMTGCSVEQLSRLKEKIDLMHTCLLENKEALDLAHGVRSQIISKVSEAVKNIQAPVCHYNKEARLTANSVPVSMLSFNKQV